MPAAACSPKPIGPAIASLRRLTAAHQVRCTAFTAQHALLVRQVVCKLFSIQNHPCASAELMRQIGFVSDTEHP